MFPYDADDDDDNDSDNTITDSNMMIELNREFFAFKQNNFMQKTLESQIPSFFLHIYHVCFPI